MKSSDRMELLRRLVARGEIECARVCALDWNMEKQLDRLLEK